MNVGTAQIIVISVITGAWIIGAIIATFDGTTMLAITTPLLTSICGWLFAARATKA